MTTYTIELSFGKLYDKLMEYYTNGIISENSDVYITFLREKKMEPISISIYLKDPVPQCDFKNFLRNNIFELFCKKYTFNAEFDYFGVFVQAAVLDTITYSQINSTPLQKKISSLDPQIILRRNREIKYGIRK